MAPRYIRGLHGFFRPLRALWMIAFVVSVNGQRVSTIGVGNSGVLGAHVSWTG
jgi:hypothetical protein